MSSSSSRTAFSSVAAASSAGSSASTGPLAALLVSAVALLATPLPAAAADTPPPPAASPAPPTTAPSDKLATARALIAQARWRDAIGALKQVNDTGSADWNNLMGYSNRKAATPDLASAEAYYQSALRIDPNHRGALEYIGELYLMLGDLAKAEQRLATLDQVCGGNCKELTELRDAMAAFKTNGNKFVAKP